MSYLYSLLYFHFTFIENFSDIEMTGAYDQLRNMVYSAIVRKVNSLVLKGGPFCSDPCWKLDLIEPLKEKEPGPVKVDDGQFELPPVNFIVFFSVLHVLVIQI